MYFTYLEVFGDALQRNSREIYWRSDIVTKFKKIIGMKEKFAQNNEIPVSLIEFMLETQESFYIFTFYDGFQVDRTFEALSFDFQLIDQKSECVSANVFPNVFP